ncbi:serine hydrolase [Alteromonas flava]|uniref:serine hydrolase n=1 Tax=Alteromonas flava TaxID=2048003 RepID=UPI0013DA374C|nr:serine hydrolase [Alteromonas flava]
MDTVVAAALDTFNTPGLSVAVVSSNTVLLQKGYGKRDISEDLPVTPQTYFRLASTSKAFTAASIAILVDQEKLNWDDRVIDHLPEFRMFDPYVTREMTVRDLLSHRSGLGGGAGDSMLWPEPAGFSRSEIVHNLRYLTPQSSFRSRYAYSNVMYITAGEIVANIAQQDWSDFVDEQLFAPLQMACFAGDVPKSALRNVALPYGFDEQTGLYLIPRNAIHHKGLASAAAGGLVCSAEEMSKWLMALLSDARAIALDQEQSYRPELPFSPQQLQEIWSPNTLLGMSEFEQEWDGTVLKAYAMGWRISHLNNTRIISHTGTLSGYQAYVALIPDVDIGVVILNNGSNYGARSAVMQSILRHFVMSAEQQDWVALYQDYQAKREQEYWAEYTEPNGTGQVVLDPLAYAGTYLDPWFGTIHINVESGTLRIRSDKMPTLVGSMLPFNDHTWVIRWDNQNAASDAFIHFHVGIDNRVNGFILAPFTSEQTDNHEWKDMRFERVKSDE